MIKEPKMIYIEYTLHGQTRLTQLDPKDIACRNRDNNFDIDRTMNLIANCFGEDIVNLHFDY